MRSYAGFRITRALVVLGLFATIVLKGGWEAAAAAFTLAMGFAFIGCTIAIGAMADRGAAPPPRRRASVRAGAPSQRSADAGERARPAERSRDRREDATPATRPHTPRPVGAH